MSAYRLHGCARCGGDLSYDEQEREWRCMLCARVAATDTPAVVMVIDPALLRGRRGRPPLDKTKAADQQ